jgi:putative ABC transport system permease protein
VLYRFFIAVALNTDFIGLQAQDLNFVTAALVTIALLIPGYRRKLSGLFSTGRSSVAAVQKEVK